MSRLAGIVFANSHDELLSKLTEKRSMASVPFGGRYRLIDFTLSNLVNAGVSNVGIITKENYRSLMDHLGSGRFWDLDRKSGGIHILPPYNISGARRYNDFIEALHGASDFIRRSNAEYMVVCNGDVVANIDISAVFEAHISNAADITLVYCNGACPEGRLDTATYEMDNEGRITSVSATCNSGETVCYGLDVMIISRTLLSELVSDAYSGEGMEINRDILAKNVSRLKIFGFKHNGYAAFMCGERAFYKANMELLQADVRKDLFNKQRPVFTKTRDDMPTRYGTKSSVENSFIAEGCVIDGTVKNSILFRGVKVAKGAVVENSIIMQGSSIESEAKLDYVIADKNVAIGSEMIIKGTENKSFLIKKNKTL